MKLDQNKIVVAMSGGVDSSVAALLLKQAGYEVIGLMLKLWDSPKNEVAKHASCCSIEDATDARRVADQLEIPFYVINSKERFQEQVINKFVLEYLQGRTPNPCAMCNDKVKFDYLHTKAFELGAHYVATGHYARRQWDESTGQWRLLKGADERKDQSYFLFTLGQKQLEHTLFPIGDLRKEEVRHIAQEHGLKTSQKPESQEICFVPDGNHGEFIEKYRQNAVGPKGQFISEAGEILGVHQGIHHYTVGQRRGTQVAQGERVYIKSIDPVSNNITIASDAALYQPSLLANRVRWVHEVSDGMEVLARIRHRHEGSEAVLRLEANDRVRVDFKEPQRAIAPGQAVVFYRGEEMLGGGWIEKGLGAS
jgi:tRNA-uridine 2-sulfurtransferase